MSGEEDERLENGENVGEDVVEAAEQGGDPSGFLSGIIGATVIVKLNSGIVFRGRLQSVDGYMNIALDGCTEVSEDGGRKIRSWGDAFIRGNNVTYICDADDDEE